MNSLPTINISYTPSIQAFIPILYVAWADRILTPTELDELKTLAEEATFISKEDKITLKKWSNPRHPPSAALFKYWEIELQRAIAQFPEGKRPTLAEVGISLAKQAKEQQSLDASDLVSIEQLYTFLHTLEEKLQQINVGTYFKLLPGHQVKALAPAKSRVIKLQQLLDEAYHSTRRDMRILLCDPAFKRRLFRDKEAHRHHVLQWISLLSEQGLGSLAFPSEYGGEKDMGKYATVFEMLGYHDLSLAIKFGVQFGLFGGSVHQLGTERHHKKYLQALGAGKLLGCFAMTETGHGSNVRGLETTAVYDPANDTFIIHSPRYEAGKEYIGNALHAHMATVFAQLIVKGENHGVHALLVPIRDKNKQLLPGIKVEDNGYKMGLNGVDNGRLWFNNVVVPRENLLNRFGDVNSHGEYHSSIAKPAKRFFTMLGTLVGGRVCVPRAGLSAAKSGLTIAIKYSLKRRQFAPRLNEQETLLLDYPSHQRRLLPLLAKAYALHFGLEHLSDRYVNHQGDDMREIETLAAGMKAYSTWFTTTCLQECREACGGKGYLVENSFADLKADTDIFTTFEGDNTVLMQLVAKGVLSEFRNEFHEDGNLAVLRYLSRQVEIAITQKNPFIIRNIGESHLTDPEFHLNAFAFRKSRLLYSLSQRMRALIKGGMNTYDAAMRCQTHMIALAEAYVEKIVLEQFQNKLLSTKASSIRPLLETLCHLYALHTIESHKGWYLENDYISGPKSKAIRRQVDQLCKAIRVDAQLLVEAFAIPDNLLDTAIVEGTAIPS